MDTSRRAGIIYAHMAALLFGGTALFAKWIPLSADVITFWRTVVALIVLFLLCRVRGQSMRLERGRDVFFQIGLGCVLGIHWATYYSAIQYSTVAIGIAALFVAPVLSVLIESAMRRELPDSLDLVLCGVVFVGVVLLIPSFDWQDDYLKGILLGVVSALFLAFRQNLHRRSRALGASSMVLLFYQLIGVGLLFMIPGLRSNSEAITANWSSFLVLGVFFTAMPHFFNVCALRELEAKSVLIITSLMLPYGIVLGIVFLGEIPSLRTLLGGSMILLAATYENLRIRK